MAKKKYSELMTKSTKQSGQLTVKELDDLRAALKAASNIVSKSRASQAIALACIYGTGIWQSQWGYNTWEEFVDAEAMVSLGTASRLRRVGEVFYLGLGVPRNKIEDAGYAVLEMLKPLKVTHKVMDESNAEKWIDYAIKKGSYRKVETYVKLLKAEIKAGNIQPGTLVDPIDVEEMKAIEKDDTKALTDDSGASAGTDYGSEDVVGTATDHDDDTGIVVTSGKEFFSDGEKQPLDPEGEKVEWKLKLEKGQMEVIQQAIDAIKVGDPSVFADNVALEMIAVSFIAEVGHKYTPSQGYIDNMLARLQAIYGGEFKHFKDSHEASLSIEDEDGADALDNIDDYINEAHV